MITNPRNEVSLESLRQAVEGQHGGRATLDRVVHVIERYGDETVWDGLVHIFKIQGHPVATECYAWAESVKDSDRRRFYAVLHEGPVDSPERAVRAAIVDAFRKRR